MKDGEGAGDENEDPPTLAPTNHSQHLSEHTLSLRRALAYCQRISNGGVLHLLDDDDDQTAMTRIPKLSATDLQQPKNSRDLEAESPSGTMEQAIRASDAVRAARCVPEQRQEALDNIILLLHNNNNNNTTAAIDIVPDLSQISKLEFQQRYLIRNQPCLIRGEIRNENKERCFAEVQRQWRTERSANDDDDDDSHSNSPIPTTTTTTRRIRRAWFLETLGSDTVVPVRYDPPPCTPGTTTTGAAGGLDDDGRAVECATKHMALGDWIRLLDDESNEHKKSKDKTRTTPLDDDGCNRNYYLKDWHLQSWLERQEQHGYGNHSTPPRMKSVSLYSVPDHFQWDLLNDFLRRFTTGDYRFVYWGPAGSQTTRHSDVMNSFSWSYNVHGVKEWKIEVPCQDDNDTDPKQSLVLLQRSGELVFVPATWKHHVVNLEETLSINHNWITTCNLDLVWECIRKEIQAVDVELRAWNIVPDDNWEARENMLRGCVGLDVSAFFFLCLVRGLDIWQQQHAKGRKCTVFEYEVWFDLVRLADTLSTVLDDFPIDLQNRLEATLCDKTLGKEAVELANAFIRIVNCMTETVL